MTCYYHWLLIEHATGDEGHRVLVPVWLVVRDCEIVRIVIDTAGIFVAAAQRAHNAYQLAHRAVQRLIKLLTGPDGQPIRTKDGKEIEVVVRLLRWLLLLLLRCPRPAVPLS
jgi:hypothetical protein